MERQRHIQFIKRICQETGLAPSALAKKAGLRESTINRFINEKSTLRSLRAGTLDAIAKVADYTSYEDAILNLKSPELAEKVGAGFMAPMQKGEIMEVAEKVLRLATKLGIALAPMQHVSATLDMYAKLKREEITGKAINDEDTVLEIVDYLREQKNKVDKTAL